MKKVVLFVIAVLVLVLGVISCSQPTQPPPDVSRYTADQVIAIARAGTSSGLPTQRLQDLTDTLWTAEYVGSGNWRVEREIRYKIGGLYKSNSWQYNENTGKLIQQK